MSSSFPFKNTAKMYRDQLVAFQNYGLSGLIEERDNQKLLWDYDKTSAIEKKVFSTSLSDTEQFKGICQMAVENPSIREKFKSNRQYRIILEHVSRAQGDQYYELIKDNQRIIENLVSIASRETGRPFTYTFDHLGKISPTQIRYAKILQDLMMLFGDLSYFSVAEIGIGNGGQAIHLLQSFKSVKYFAFDLPEVLNLSKLLITNYDRNFDVEYFSGDAIYARAFDLVISNFAFSELASSIQRMYLENVIKSSKRGYMIYNDINPLDEEVLTAVEFLSKINGAEIFMEKPLTYKGNCLIVWGHNKNIPDTHFVKL